jgi:hypothetical protein
MITEDYVSFETVKLLKEKGFNENTDKQFNLDKIVGDYDITDRSRHPERYLDAPTLQMAVKWLREREWFICVIPLAFYCGTKTWKFGYNIWASDNLEVDELNTPEFNTYEEACEAAIKYCLENLI